MLLYGCYTSQVGIVIRSARMIEFHGWRVMEDVARLKRWQRVCVSVCLVCGQRPISIPDPVPSWHVQIQPITNPTVVQILINRLLQSRGAHCHRSLCVCPPIVVVKHRFLPTALCNFPIVSSNGDSGQEGGQTR